MRYIPLKCKKGEPDMGSPFLHLEYNFLQILQHTL